MVAKGIKDDTIARRLGISLRTCRRHVSELLDALSAPSRFEAGVIAERQGLTRHPASPPLPVPATEAAPDTVRPDPVPSAHGLRRGPAHTDLSTSHRPTGPLLLPQMPLPRLPHTKSPRDTLPQADTAHPSRNPPPA
ncbi:response regulator transcription factor [Streptomyces sp. WM6372]|uniref:response regulator transcription factor n=1 Tax=Streptomyces sp. WM6372 TaxID=1415555 RepID=UPI00099DDCF7